MPLAVLISGGGTTLRNLYEKIAAENLPIKVRLVISSNPRARGLQYAEEHGAETEIIRRADFSTEEAFSEALFGRCRDAQVELVVMGGFLSFVRIPPDFENRVMNIHPALIPAFCGKGYYGLRVHQAVLEYGAKVSGCTVHFVDNEYDHGPVILQHATPVLDGDTVETLAARIFQAECVAYPEAIRLFAEGRLRVAGRIVSQD